MHRRVRSVPGYSLPILSLFSGTGGLDLGFAKAGFSPLLAIDNDQVACLTYWHNQARKSRTVVLCKDLAATRGRDVIRLWRTAWPGKRPIGVIAGPPCQAFSRGNVRKRDSDPRARLAFRFAKLLGVLNKEFGLDFFVFENVGGLKAKAHVAQYRVLLRAFIRAGFLLFEKKMDAQNYGVPQRRVRLIVVGVNARKFRKFKFEFPTESRHKVITVEEAIHGLPEPTYYRPGITEADLPTHPNHWTMRPKSKKFSTKSSKRQTYERSFQFLSWGRPSLTVAYGHREIHVHPNGHRRLSIYEAMRLQGFPKSYELRGTLSDQVRLVSDAVPPPLAKAIAMAIRGQLYRRRPH